MATFGLADRPVARGSDVGSEEEVYAERARRLGLPFVARVAHPLAMPTLDAIREATLAKAAGLGAAYIAPAEEGMSGTLGWLARYPAARSRLVVTTRSAIRMALIATASRRLAMNAIGRLAALYPALSARRRATTAQLVAGACLTATAGAAIYLKPAVTLGVINVIGALFFLGMTVMRFIAAAATKQRSVSTEGGPYPEDEELPVYSVLVPLLNEANIVADLVAALDRLDWPRDRLDIKLIVEAKDPATTAAALRAVTGPHHEVIVVPDVAPATKPKALAFALPLARGDYVTVYDAEDRPHPGQLREAHAVFARSPPDLACLQSPLLVDNRNDSWFTRQFAIEYSSLFDGVLPTLAQLGMPLPLGGTSNHFRGIR